MIQLKNISKSYGPLRVLENVSLSIPDGEIAVILGPSGAGKTTLLQIAGTLDRPDSGVVEFDGVEASSMNEKRLASFRNERIGFVFQFHELLPEFTATENVAMPALIAGLKRKEALGEARRLLERFGLGTRMDHKPSELSGGEKQRVAIARALINKPRIIMADEPTGSLDSRNRDEIKSLISDLCHTEGQTFLMVTHDAEMASIAHTIIEMADGKIINLKRPHDYSTDDTVDKELQN